jgi:hypothetical protein
MSTTTWATIRPELSRELGVVEAATTTDIAGNNLVISTALAALYTSNNDLKGWWCLLLDDADGGSTGINKPGGTNDAGVRRVTAYTASSGTLTVAGAVFTAENESINFELHRFNPVELLSIFNRARQNLSGKLFIQRDIQIVLHQDQRRLMLSNNLRGAPLQVLVAPPLDEDQAHNLLTDGGLEAWTTTTSPTNWALTGTGATITQESALTTPRNYQVLTGSYSGKLLSASSGATNLLQTVTPEVATESARFQVAGWVYSLTAARLAMTQTSNTPTSGPGVHGGTGWEHLYHDVSQAATVATLVDIGLNITAGTVFVSYVDNLNLYSKGFPGTEAATVFSPEIDSGWSPLMGWDWLPATEGEASNGQLILPDTLPMFHRIRIIGQDTLSAVSTDSSSIEVEEWHLEPLYYETLRLASRQTSNISVSGADDAWEKRAVGYQRDRDQALRDGKRTRIPVRLSDPHGML